MVSIESSGLFEHYVADYNDVRYYIWYNRGDDEFLVWHTDFSPVLVNIRENIISEMRIYFDKLREDE